MDDLPSHVRQIAAVLGRPVTRDQANAISNDIRPLPGSIEERLRDYFGVSSEPNETGGG